MRLRRVKRDLKRMRDCQRGTAAMELALLTTVLLVPLYISLLEVSDAMTVNRRVATSVNAFADLTAQSAQLSPTELVGLMKGVELMLAPQDTSALTIEIVSVELVDNKPVVHWSLSRNPDGEPYAPGQPFTLLDDAEILLDVPSLIFVEMSYKHDLILVGELFEGSVEYKRSSIRYPRLSDKVQYCPTPDTCTT